VKAIRAIIAAVADLLRVGRVPIARERVIVNLDTTPVQLHTTTFQTGDPTGARNFSYLDRIHLIRLFTVGRATLSFSLVLVWFDGVARIAGSSRIARTARSGGRAEIAYREPYTTTNPTPGPQPAKPYRTCQFVGRTRRDVQVQLKNREYIRARISPPEGGRR
jgi:hypothetical protein